MAQCQFRSDDTRRWLYGYGNGSDGALTPSGTTDAPINAACTGTSGLSTLSATNASFAAGQLVIIHQTFGTSAGQWELNRITSYVAGTITLTHPLTVTFGSGAQVQVMKQYTTVSLPSGTWTASAFNATSNGILAFFAKTSAVIAGTIDAAGRSGGTGVASGGQGTGFRGGTSQSAGVGAQANQGDGTTGLQNNSSSANGNGGGGGFGGSSGVAHDGAGGGGGNGTVGVAGGGNGGAPTVQGAAGGTAGVASLITMVFGGGGGGGSNRVDDPARENAGGGGGGIVLIISPSISGAGTILLSGAGTASSDAAGGGGAGGSCLLKGQVISGVTITATGGAAGAGADPAGDGGVGRVHADYLTSVSVTSNPAIDSRQDATLLDVNNGGGALFAMY
jgi:hypothetical protein